MRSVELRVGNIVEEFTYSDYQELNEPDYRSDVLFPRRITEKRNGMTVADLTIQRTNTYNPYVVMPVPASQPGLMPNTMMLCSSCAICRVTIAAAALLALYSRL